MLSMALLLRVVNEGEHVVVNQAVEEVGPPVEVGLDNQCSKCLHPTPKLNATTYICNNNTVTAFRKLGGLICSGACLGSDTSQFS